MMRMRASFGEPERFGNRQIWPKYPRQVLTPQNFAQVLTGMPMETVRKMLGKPMKISPFALQQTTHYDWRCLNPPTTAMIFTAVFDQSLSVVSTGSVIEESANPKGP